MNSILLGVVGLMLVGLAAATWKAPRLTSVIVWALVAAIFSSAALLIRAPGPFPDKALWVALSVPLIWCGFQFWTYWDTKGWRVAVSLILISVVSAALVFTGSPNV